MICKTISTFVYRDRTKLYSADTSKNGEKRRYGGAPINELAVILKSIPE